MVVSAASSSTSATPAGSSLPIGCWRSIRISRCRPLWRQQHAVRRVGARRASRRTARASARPVSRPSARRTTSAPSLDGVARRRRRASRRPAARPVEEAAREGDHLGAALRVVALGAGRRARGRRCRRARRRGCPSARWRRSARSGRWRPAPPAAGRPACAISGSTFSVPIWNGAAARDAGSRSRAGRRSRRPRRAAGRGARATRRRSAPAARRGGPAGRRCAGVKSARMRSSAAQNVCRRDARARQQLLLHEGVQDVVDRKGVADVHRLIGLSIRAWRQDHRRSRPSG